MLFVNLNMFKTCSHWNLCLRVFLCAVKSCSYSSSPLPTCKLEFEGTCSSSGAIVTNLLANVSNAHAAALRWDMRSSFPFSNELKRSGTQPELRYGRSGFIAPKTPGNTLYGTSAARLEIALQQARFVGLQLLNPDAQDSMIACIPVLSLLTPGTCSLLFVLFLLFVTSHLLWFALCSLKALRPTPPTTIRAEAPVWPFKPF